jgi:magnesium-protoporphyrin IX monomethyl ester (oxidative) cyclase
MPKNKVLFINPPQSCGIKARYSNFKFPLGFLYMAGHLEKKGFEVKILDCPLHYRKRKIVSKDTVKIGLFSKDIEREILDFKPDIVGVSCAYSAYEQDSFEIIELVRKIEPKLGKKVVVVVGGAHTSANPAYVLRNNNIDIAVIGEGEEAMLEIAEKYSRGKSLDSIKGTAVRKNKNIKINQPRQYIQNLDNLKPSWHLLDMPLYFNHPDNSSVTLRQPSIDIITSRGCPGNCVFCSIHTVWGRCWRGRSVKNVVDELEFLFKKYNVRQFRIQDDNLTLDRKRILGICSEIIKRNLDIRWDTPNGIAIWTLDKEVLRMMRKAGCYRITFGIESGSKRSQEYVRKIVDMGKIKDLIDYCHKIGIWVCSTFIIGFPYETKEDIEETKRFILNSKINFPFVYIAQPYPGTDMYNDFKKENLLDSVHATSNIGNSRYNTLNFTNKELNRIRSNIYKRFYLKKTLFYLINPMKLYSEILSKIRTYEDIKYLFKNMKSILLS